MLVILEFSDIYLDLTIADGMVSVRRLVSGR